MPGRNRVASQKTAEKAELTEKVPEQRLSRIRHGMFCSSSLFVDFHLPRYHSFRSSSFHQDLCAFVLLLFYACCKEKDGP